MSEMLKTCFVLKFSLWLLWFSILQLSKAYWPLFCFVLFKCMHKTPSKKWIFFFFNVQNEMENFPIKWTVTQFNTSSHTPQQKEPQAKLNLASFILCWTTNFCEFFFLSVTFLSFCFLLSYLTGFSMEAFPDGCCL